MKIKIFLLCYNEELILPSTLKYYKSRFPSAEIHLIDNCSTDRSCEIARENGCKIKSYETNNTHDESYLIWVRSHIWKEFVSDDWVIMCDMDEWLDMTEEQLEQEEKNGTTIIKTQGVNMVGESKEKNLSDISLFDVKKGFLDDSFSKSVCFKYPEVSGIEYWYGAHKCFPQGKINYSEKVYYLKHYNYLGEEYLVEKHRLRFERNEASRRRGLNGHYSNNKDNVVKLYRSCVEQAVVIN